MFEWLKSKFKKNDVTENTEENVDESQLADSENINSENTDFENSDSENSGADSVETNNYEAFSESTSGAEQSEVLENNVENEPVQEEKFASDSNLANAHRMLSAFSFSQAEEIVSNDEASANAVSEEVAEPVAQEIATESVDSSDIADTEVSEVITDESTVTEENAATEENTVTEESTVIEENVTSVESVVTENNEVTEVIEAAEAIEAGENAEEAEPTEITETTIDSETTELSEEDTEPVKKKGFFSRLFEGLTKTRDNIVAGMDELFSSDDKIDDDFYEELEEILILGDIGVHTTENILEKLKAQVKSEHIKKRTQCKELLIANIKEEMAVEETAYKFETEQSIVFVIGVNGVGKTTSIGKLASHLKNQGKRVMLVAADTFRAAAGSQLEEWSHRAGVEMIGGKAGQDPASVLFDGVEAAKARNVDVLLVDTAGRLHNKKNLMEELKKMNRIIDKSFPNAHRENLIVLDASTGQNALNQAKEFGEVADLTGIILTKMDGTAKGGIAIAISSELNIPVKYIGVGEKISDLQKFDSDLFVDALFAVNLDDDNDEDNADDEENIE